MKNTPAFAVGDLWQMISNKPSGKQQTNSGRRWMSEDDRDYLRCAKEAFEDQVEWRIDD